MKNRKLGTMLADDDAGYGHLNLDQWFIDETPLFRADVLRDLITELQEHYLKARSDMAQEFMSDRAAAIKKARGEA